MFGVQATRKTNSARLHFVDTRFTKNDEWETFVDCGLRIPE